MKTVFLYFFVPVIFLSSCNLFENKDVHVIRQNVVYVSMEQQMEDQAKSLKPNQDTSYIEFILKNYNLINIKKLDSSIQVDLRYADTNNFLKRDFYDGLRNAYFNCETALRVCAAQYYLKQIHPNLSILVLDASRPQHIQQMMWDSLKVLPDKKPFYLAPPEETSLHNYGAAVDATIIDITTGNLLDMGTRFDHFGVLSEPIYEEKFLKMGLLTQQAYENRLLLRRVMQRAKLNPITSEWWHFSICNKAEAVKRFELIK